MAKKTYTIRMDDALKEKFDTICDELGLNASGAITIFANAVVRERRIPFEITAGPISTKSDEEE